MPPLSRRSMLYTSAASLAFAALPQIADAQRASPNGRGATADARPAPPAQGAIAQDTEWRHFAGELNSQRYSPLDQIKPSNFQNLQVAWRFKPDVFGPRPEFSYEG